jgi:hypothetical protein
MKKMIKGLASAIVMGSTMLSTVGVFADVNVSYSNSGVYKNIKGDFTLSDSYYYSTEDKSTSKHSIVFTVGSKTVDKDGTNVVIDEPPYINNGRVMLPLRAVMETLSVFENDVQVSWNSNDKEAVVAYNGNKIEIVFKAGSDEYTINGKVCRMSGGTPEIKNGRIFIPLREVGTAMDLNIDWNSSNKSATINNKN